MTTQEREPCPDRILDDVGAAFGMGAVGSTAFHFIKGAYNSPNGHRLSGGAQAVRMSAPRTGGSFAAWGGLYSAFDCAMVYARQKEDPWNSIIAGAAAGGVLSIRQGLFASGRAALFGASILALVEGSGLMLNRALSDLQTPVVEDPDNPAYSGLPWLQPQRRIVVEEVSAPEPTTVGWFRGLFGRKEKAAAGDRKSDLLESFDTPSPPIPSFDYKRKRNFEISPRVSCSELYVRKEVGELNTISGNMESIYLSHAHKLLPLIISHVQAEEHLIFKLDPKFQMNPMKDEGTMFVR